MLAWFAGKTIGQLTGKLAPYIVIAGLALILGSVLRVNQNLNRELGESQANLATVISFNETNTETIETLKTENDACIALFNTTKKDQDILVLKLENERDDIKRERDNAKAKRIEIFRDPDCNELGRINVANVCPDGASRLRNAAAFTNTNET